MRCIIVNKIFFISCFFIASCKKFVEINPPVTRPSAAVVYSTDATAKSVLNGIYTQMASPNSTINGLSGFSIVGGLAADELQAYTIANTQLQQVFSNSLMSSSVPFWDQCYNIIYTTNAAIEGLAYSQALSPSIKQQLTGEAKFLRAFIYFHLVNYFGDIPLNLTTDYRITSIAFRTPKSEVYQQIILDLKDAQGLLSPRYLGLDLVNTTAERVRPTSWAATALLSRVYLYTGDYVNAEAEATKIIDNTSTFTLQTDLNKVFIKNSGEAIWQFQPIATGGNAPDGNVFVLNGPPTSNRPVTLSTQLYNAFEASDDRKTKWVSSITSGTSTYYFPNKYKIGNTTSTTVVSEYQTIFRLAEQYLIRAEARAQQNNTDGSKNDINVIRTRAGLSFTIASDKSSLLNAIEQERRIELFTELGHRWLDLKRTNRIDAVMTLVTPSKGGTWHTNWQLFPIPLDNINTDNNLIQNSGY